MTCAHPNTPSRYVNTRREYRAFMSVERSMKEVAIHLGYTINGVQKTLERMVSRGEVKKIEYGPRRKRFIWIGG